MARGLEGELEKQDPVSRVNVQSTLKGHTRKGRKTVKMFYRQAAVDPSKAGLRRQK